MLAPTPFKTPQELGITKEEHAALTKVLHMMEDGKIPENQFDMKTWDNCICGWARRVSGEDQKLFYNGYSADVSRLFRGVNANVETAAGALRAFLLTGHPAW